MQGHNLCILSNDWASSSLPLFFSPFCASSVLSIIFSFCVFFIISSFVSQLLLFSCHLFLSFFPHPAIYTHAQSTNVGAHSICEKKGRRPPAVEYILGLRRLTDRNHRQ